MPEDIFQDQRVKTGEYKKVATLVREWIELHPGERFSLEQICRDIEIRERQNRQYVSIELARLAKQGTQIEKFRGVGGTSPHPSPYRVLNKDVKEIDWVNAIETETLPVVWPRGRSDDTAFGFDGCVVIHPGDIVIVAGVSNTGKTTFCQNFLWDNMDLFPCTVLANEYVPSKFKARVSRMDWASPLRGDGSPKFELIDRRDGWADVIRPNNINIIDWLNISDNFYQIGQVIESIQARLVKGMALIAIQKNPHAELGRGGAFSEDLSSLYLSLDFNRLTVRKAKEWWERDPNRKMYGFEIVGGGTQFANIREVRTCRGCHGSGKIWRKGTGEEQCGVCFGVGYLDARECNEE